MTPNQLLQECEVLTHNGRMRRMVELGQLAASDNSIRETLAILAQGDVYQRILATQACHGSRDAAQVLRALTDPSHSVRSLALSLAALVCNDAELQSALERLLPDLQITLLRNLCRRKRQVPVDLYLETLAARNDIIFKELLVFGSRAIVARYFEQASATFTLTDMCRFARQYPDLVVEQWRAKATASTVLDPQLIGQINTVLPHLTNNAPDLALGLVKTLLEVVPLARLNLQSLVRKRPDEMVDLLLASNVKSNIRFDAVAHRLNTERLIALFTRYPITINARCFSKLNPQQRLAIYTVCERGWRNPGGALEDRIIATLPAEQRVKEGRRHLELPALAALPQKRFPYATFLPWDEARTLLDTPLRSPDADLRAAAINALIGTTRYERSHLTDVLQLVRQRRYEQDPVRQAMFRALAALPHSIWQAEHLNDLAQVIRDALNATDLSHATAQAMERLVVQTFPFHAEWSANQMAIIYRERGRISVFQLDRYLSDAHIRSIAPALTPILRSWQSRESEGLLVTLATALGKRLSVFDELLDLLETTLNQTLHSHIADSILRLFLEHQRARAYLLIPRLLRNDKSAITLSAVYTYLHRYRQDLITPFLGQFAYIGRFSTGITRFILPLNDGFQRWTPRQQEMYTHTLLEVVRAQDQNRATHEWLTTIHRMAAMPAIDFTPLIQLASDERPAVREATLRTLGRLDAGQGIPTLLEALNDARARIAIYALRDALLSMPQTEALALLRKVPLTQVTVAKEAVRLIGELASEEAYRELLSWETRELHRDVRVALLRALWDYLDYPETWDIFTRAAQTSEAAIAHGVVHIPADGMSPLIQQQLAILTATLLAHPELEVRIATLRWRERHPLTDHKHVLFTRLLALMESPSPHECGLAAETAFTAYIGNDAALVGEAIQAILNNRRALHRVIEHFVAALSYNRNHLLPTTRAILAVLAQDRLTLTLRVSVIIGGLPWQEVTQELVKLAGVLHADALSKAQQAIQQAHTRRPDAQLFDLEMTLAANTDEHLRKLALTVLTTRAQQASGWSDEAIARLEQYRNDPSPLVAEAAQFTFVP